MKRTAMIGLVVAALIISGTAPSLLAQNGPGNGRGYGGPPKSEQERIARQAAGQAKNGGICPNGGPSANCPGIGKGKGQGQGQGQGKGQRRGTCDGTGPRAGKATCPVNGQMQK